MIMHFGILILANHLKMFLNQLQSKPAKLNRRKLVDEELAKARASILEAASNRNTTMFNIDLPNPEIYRNPSALYR